MLMADSNSPSLRLLVVEEQELYHALYPAVFTGQSELRLLDVISRCNDAEITEIVKTTGPDVLLYSIVRIDEDIIKQFVRLRREFPATSIVTTIIINDVTTAHLLRGIMSEVEGGLGLFLKQSVRRPSELKAIITSVAGGQVIIDPELTRAVFSEARDSLMDSLTAREQETLSFIAGGYTNEAIANILGIDTRTVRHHINSIYSKLRADLCFQQGHPRVSAARFYMERTGELSGMLTASR